MTATPQTFDADTCEQIFHDALAAGNIKGVEAALTVMAPQDPHRAQGLLDTLSLGLALTDRRPTSDTPTVVRRRSQS
ncbi:hypothetical protein AB0J14_05230 [Micromonospora arborensis]|uniref:hypothetical protein n=1 Tax=Micromonospora arborensis TaxID=2116518 RepID=UPI0033E91173